DDLLWNNGSTFAEWQSTGSGFTPNVFVGSLSQNTSIAGNATTHASGKSTSTSHSPGVINDFNGDGTGDVLWRNPTTGQVGYWDMHGAQHGWTLLGGSGIDHHVVGTGDFNGDGTQEVLWRDDVGGNVGFWTINANGTDTWHDLGGSGVNFKVAGTGD